MIAVRADVGALVGLALAVSLLSGASAIALRHEGGL